MKNKSHRQRSNVLVHAGLGLLLFLLSIPPAYGQVANPEIFSDVPNIQYPSSVPDAHFTSENPALGACFCFATRIVGSTYDSSQQLGDTFNGTLRGLSFVDNEHPQNFLSAVKTASVSLEKIATHSADSNAQPFSAERSSQAYAINLWENFEIGRGLETRQSDDAANLDRISAENWGAHLSLGLFGRPTSSWMIWETDRIETARGFFLPNMPNASSFNLSLGYVAGSETLERTPLAPPSAPITSTRSVVKQGIALNMIGIISSLMFVESYRITKSPFNISGSEEGREDTRGLKVNLIFPGDFILGYGKINRKIDTTTTLTKSFDVSWGGGGLYLTYHHEQGTHWVLASPERFETRAFALTAKIPWGSVAKAKDKLNL